LGGGDIPETIVSTIEETYEVESKPYANTVWPADGTITVITGNKTEEVTKEETEPAHLRLALVCILGGLCAISTVLAVVFFMECRKEDYPGADRENALAEQQYPVGVSVDVHGNGIRGASARGGRLNESELMNST